MHVGTAHTHTHTHSLSLSAQYNTTQHNTHSPSLPFTHNATTQQTATRTEVCLKVFDKLNPALVLLLPELEVPVHAGGDDKVRCCDGHVRHHVPVHEAHLVAAAVGQMVEEQLLVLQPCKQRACQRREKKGTKE